MDATLARREVVAGALAGIVLAVTVPLFGLIVGLILAGAGRRAVGLTLIALSLLMMRMLGRGLITELIG